ncbi:MAG: hypothetical protein NTU47_03160 [Ignavibacteriales bacterium]|nr:hypothetical protein [Ignavibacteriales bacterium]
MRRKLKLAYLVILLLVGMQAVMPQSKPPQPDLPEIWLYYCIYDTWGNYVSYVCIEVPTRWECARTSCVD